jgi:nucleoside-diphosphate-sugar epimerase
MTAKRVLIAGCGDLGWRVARLLASESPAHCIWGIRRSVGPQASCELSGFTWIQADLTQSACLRELPEGITHVIYAAAPDSRTEAQYRAIYRQGLEQLLQRLSTAYLQRVLFISSTAVYGDHGSDWIDEDTPPAPKGFNGRVLLETEQWLQQHSQFETVSLRLSGIYGPGRSQLIERLRAGLVPAPATESHWVNRIHIEDAAAAVLHVLNIAKPQPIYLVTDSTPLPMRSLYEALAKLVGGPRPAIGAAPESVGSKRLSNSRLRNSGFKFKWPDSRDGHAALLKK